MGDPPYPSTSRLPRSWAPRSAYWVRRLIIVGTSTVCVTRSRSTVAPKDSALNFGIVTCAAPTAGAANMSGKSAMWNIGAAWRYTPLSR